MIDFVVAAEFDNLKGAIIRQTFPLVNLSAYESYVASCMIPDGAHKRDTDTCLFNIVISEEMTEKNKMFYIDEFNSREVAVNIRGVTLNPSKPENNFDYSNAMLLFEKNCFVAVNSLKEKKTLLEIPLKEVCNLKTYSGLCFMEVRSSDLHMRVEFLDSKELICFKRLLEVLTPGPSVTSKYNCYNFIKVQKSNKFQRGALLRAICIFSSSVDVFIKFDELLEAYLEDYFAVAANVNESEANVLNKMLETLYANTNRIVRESSLFELCIPDREMNYLDMVENEKADGKLIEFNNFIKASLLDLVRKFKDKTMVLYNAILRGKKIIIYCEDSSIYEICKMVTACINLVSPINIKGKIFPLISLQDLSFLSVDGYIAGVSNPLFKNKKDWWDICCDLKAEKIIDKTGQSLGLFPLSMTKEDVKQMKYAKLQSDFINDVLRQMKTEGLKEKKLREHFYNFTKNFLEFSSNFGNFVDFSKEDQELVDCFEAASNEWKASVHYQGYQNYLSEQRAYLKMIFGENYLKLSKALNEMLEKSTFDEVALFEHYETLLTCFKDETVIKVFFDQLLIKKTDLNVLGSGLFSSNMDIVKKTVDLLSIIEKSRFKKILLSRLSYFTLFAYENMKRALVVEVQLSE